MDHKISVIIPAHNEENYIKKSLHSLKSQTYQNFETIVVCNGCTDNTEELVRKRSNERLKFFSLPEANVSKARNFGAKLAYGDIFLFLDADTSLENDALQKIKDQFTEKQAVATLKSKPDQEKLKYKFALAIKNFYNSTGLYHGCSGALICRKEDFFKVGGYDPSIIVKEHRKLTLSLEKATEKKFKCIPSYATTSMRRYKEWGLTKSTLFWAKQWLKDNFGDLSQSDYEKVR